LAFERTGKLIAVQVREGDIVQKNQTIAQLDTRNLDAQKKTLAQQLAAAKARLNELVAGPRSETIESAKADLTALQSVAKQATTNYERRKLLRDSGAISKEEFDRAQSVMETAVANATSAQKKLDELLAGTRVEQVNAQKFTVEQLKQSIEEIDLEITKSSLKAPYAAQISKRHVDEGAIVNFSTPIVRVVEVGKLEAWIGLPPSIASSFRVGDSCTLFVSGKTYFADVKNILPEVDQATRTRQVVFEMNATLGQIAPGEIVRIHRDIETRTGGIWVPTESLIPAARGMWTVLVAKKTDDQHIVAKREVEVLATQGDQTLVRGTLADGDLIIRRGVHRVVVGQPIEPIKARVASKPIQD
jgi:multidrug efflux pump subunit AcrA (membrane-fusion protein)